MTYSEMLKFLDKEIKEANEKAAPYIKFDYLFDKDAYSFDVNDETEILRADDVYGLMVNGSCYDYDVELDIVLNHLNAMADAVKEVKMYEKYERI